MKIIILICGFNALVHAETVEIRTDCGLVKGETEDGAFAFLGIPYALPPIGKLRWRPPERISKVNNNCWMGTYDATQHGNTCYQIDPLDRSLTGSEDCLYLNVHTPDIGSCIKKPVMVWIHGGSLQFTNGNWPLYSPTAKLARETDIIYVSFNYRLHAFGFMALQMLADNSPTHTSGNYGFMDIIAVLEWVQTNIGSFGGDPNQVTLFGQSSGGTAIVALLASPLCQGLFHKAWLLSASPILNKTAADAFNDNEMFLKNTNCSTIECLYALSSKEVTEAVPWNTYPYWAMEDQGDLPVKNHFDGAIAIVDGLVLKEAPFDAWANGQIVDVPLLIGSCANEIDFLPSDMSLNNWTWDKYEDHLRQTIGTFNDKIMLKTAYKLYPPYSNTPEYQFTSMASDIRVNCPNDMLALYAASTFTSPVYRYVVTYHPSVPVNVCGIPFPAAYAFHMLDVFGFFGFMPDYIEEPSDKDMEWQENVRREILAFVRTGTPHSNTWLPYPEVTLLLSDVSTSSGGYNSVKCEFWMKHGLFSYAWIN